MGEPLLTTTVPDLRVWAIGQGLAGTRGPIGYDTQLAYADAFGLPAPPPPAPRTTTVPVRAPKRERKFAGSTCSCGRRWEGLVECHCRGCHRHFRASTWFDLHLSLGPDGETSVCSDPHDITYRSGVRKGEPKMRLVRSHHGEVWTSAEERPSQESIFGDAAPADSE